MLREAYQLAIAHQVALAALAWYLWQVMAQSLPEPLPSERWYRAVYVAIHEIAFNHDRAAAARATATNGGKLNA